MSLNITIKSPELRKLSCWVQPAWSWQLFYSFLSSQYGKVTVKEQERGQSNPPLVFVILLVKLCPVRTIPPTNCTNVCWQVI